MNKKHYIGIGVVLAILLIFMISKYLAGGVTASGVTISSDVEKLEVIHFYSTSQCYSCIAMGELARDTLDTYFSKELGSGKIAFEHINVDLSENSEKVKKYGATGSSLLIGVYYEDGTFLKEQDTNVWYKLKDKQGFLTYFKGVVESKLSGE